MLLAVVIGVAGAAGCVERRMIIRSNPSGAEVWLNDEPVGTTPVVVNFTWYNEYDLIVRKRGYKTHNGGYRPAMPIHQAPPFDLFAEALWPGTIVDEHEVEVTLAPQEPADREQVIARSIEMRDQARQTPPKRTLFGNADR